MTNILNDFILKNLSCSVCDRYLSVLPIKVYPNGKIKCGRCCEENDGGVESLYNTVVTNCLFKCVNRYEGCNKIMDLSEVKEHEKKCISENYPCPKCEYKFHGSAYQLLVHYKKHHPKSVLRNGSFSVKVKQVIWERYLYLIKDNVFFVLMENLPQEKILYLSVASLTTCKNVEQWFSVKPSHKSANSSTTTEKKLCQTLENFECDYFTISTNSVNEISCRLYLDLSQNTNVINQILTIPKNPTSEWQQQLQINTPESTDVKPQESDNSTAIYVQTIPMKDVLGVKLSDEFREKYPGYELTPCGTALFKDDVRIELTCSNCKQLTGCNVFNCHSNKHIVCWDCKAWCGICHTTISGWNVNIANINESLLLPCRWNCGKYFLGNRLTQHELSCEKCRCKCPMCNMVYICNLNQLDHHLSHHHQNYNATHFNLTGYLKECHGQSKNNEVCFFQNGYWFKMHWVKKQNSYELLIVSVDDVDLFEPALVCDTDKNMYNKIGNGRVTVTLADNPKFYLKRIRNL